MSSLCVHLYANGSLFGGMVLRPKDFPSGSDGKASTCNAGNPGSVPGLGRPPGEENGKPLEYSGLENPMDRGAWRATVHGIAKSGTRPSDFTFPFTYAVKECSNCILVFLKDPPRCPP